jgi:predicted glycosyltransferase
MKKVMFYCQHILGMGHLVRSMEIVRSLVSDFQVCFINGGQVIQEFPAPPAVEVINIPAIKTDSEFQQLSPVDDSLTLEEVQILRREQLLNTFNRFQLDILIVELFPFGRRRFSFELIPLMEVAKTAGTKVVCSLRDIVVTKQDRQRHEEKICRLMNQYFDMLLIHGDPRFIELGESFSRVRDLNCAVHYTGYVAQKLPKTIAEAVEKPLILASIGGGRFGHKLLECLVKAAPILKQYLPHHIRVFTGPFAPDDFLTQLHDLAAGQDNITVERFTPNLLDYMQQADLSISMSGYNTTLNVLMTGVRAMILPFTGNNDQEQTIRSTRLEELGRVKAIRPEDLEPEQFARQIIEYLRQQPAEVKFDFDGAEKTAYYLHQLVQKQAVAV